MELLLERKAFKPEYTIGHLFVDGVKECDVLEDTVRTGPKVYGKTAIPAGRYEVVITFSQRFQRDMPLLLNVPGFDGIRIHPGNTAEDTHGCLLVGKNTVVGKVTESRDTYNKLYPKIEAAFKAKDPIFITIS